MLTVRFQRVSPTHHRISYRCRDGSGEEAIVETKSLLTHDFLHFALESEAGLTRGFFGLLAQGYSYEQLAGKEASDYPAGQAQQIERVVGPLSSAVKEEVDPDSFLNAMDNIFSAYGESVPEWLTSEVLVSTESRFKKIMGQWNSLPFGQVLELYFGPSKEPEEAPVVSGRRADYDDDAENLTNQTL